MALLPYHGVLEHLPAPGRVMSTVKCSIETQVLLFTWMGQISKALYENNFVVLYAVWDDYRTESVRKSDHIHCK